MTTTTYEYKYLWPRIPSDVTTFTFKLRAQNDGHLSLSPGQVDSPDLVEIGEKKILIMCIG